MPPVCRSALHSLPLGAVRSDWGRLAAQRKHSQPTSCIHVLRGEYKRNKKMLRYFSRLSELPASIAHTSLGSRCPASSRDVSLKLTPLGCINKVVPCVCLNRFSGPLPAGDYIREGAKVNYSSPCQVCLVLRVLAVIPRNGRKVGRMACTLNKTAGKQIKIIQPELWELLNLPLFASNGGLYFIYFSDNLASFKRNKLKLALKFK